MDFSNQKEKMSSIQQSVVSNDNTDSESDVIVMDEGNNKSKAAKRRNEVIKANSM